MSCPGDSHQEGAMVSGKYWAAQAPEQREAVKSWIVAGIGIKQVQALTVAMYPVPKKTYLEEA